MSKVSIFQYPVLTDSLLKRIGYMLNATECSYQDEKGKHPLKCESEEGATSRSTLMRVVDEYGQWHPDRKNLEIRLSGEIENPLFLFGKDGLLPKGDSIMGIGLIWTDKDSKIRGSLELGTIRGDSSDSVEFERTVYFNPGELRGTLSLRTILYVIRCSDKNKDGHFFAEKQGTLLGTLDDQKFIIEGSGSVFPTSDVEEPGQPLWWIETDIDDPNTDLFDEDHFVLNLNKANPAYPLLQLDEQGSPMLAEVIASALFTLITEVRSAEGGDEAIRTATNAEPGSVARIINYMLKTNNWMNVIDRPADLQRAIHKWASDNLSDNGKG